MWLMASIEFTIIDNPMKMIIENVTHCVFFWAHNILHIDRLDLGSFSVKINNTLRQFHLFFHRGRK